MTDLKTHYSARELAGLPGLPGTERAIQLRADREQWPFRKRQGRGGGREYPIACLPLEAREALLDQSRPATALPVAVLASQPPAKWPEVKVLPITARLKDWQRRTMDARLVLMREIQHNEPFIGVSKAVEKLVKGAANGTLAEHLQAAASMANARSGAAEAALSKRTVLRWWSDFKKSDGNYAVLAPKDVEKDEIPSWYPAFRPYWSRATNPSITECLRDMERDGLPIPSYTQARNYLKKIGAVEKAQGRMGHKEIKNIKGFRRRDTSNLLPGDIYTADGHTFDAEVQHPYHGRPFRPEVTIILDVATRKPVGWSVSLAESSIAVLDALRHACETSGIPAIFYTDNGPGYRAEFLTAEGCGLLARLGIKGENSLAGHSQSRGIIERSIQTILVASAKKLPTYIGHRMDRDAKKLVFKATRKQIKLKEQGVSDLTARLLPTWQEFIGMVEESIAEYCNRPHRGLPRIRDAVSGSWRHMTPNQAWQAAIDKGWTPTPAHATEDLYHPQVTRTVQRCEVALWNNIYYSADLMEWHGEEVFVAFDIHDPSTVILRDGLQRYICTAKHNGNKSDYFPVSYVEQQRERRADAALQRLQRKADEIELERRGPAIDVPPAIIELSPETIEFQRRLEEKEEKKQASAQQFIPNNDAEAYLRLCEEERGGMPLSQQEKQWLEDYRHWTSTGKKVGLHREGWQPFAERYRKAAVAQ